MRPHHHSHRLLQLLADNHQRGLGLRSEIANDVATIFLYDVIDPYFGVNAVDFAGKLAEARNAGSILLRVNSPGGDVFEARAIASLMATYADRIDVQVDGLAASAATTVSLAGRTLKMAPGSMYMIHNAWCLAVGNKAELRATADLLDKVDGQIAADYARATGKGVEEMAALMDAETWMTAEECIANGFASGLVDKGAASNVAAWNLNAYSKTPAALVSTAKPPVASRPDTALRDFAARALRLHQLHIP